MNLIEAIRVAGSRIFPVKSPDAMTTLIERNRRAERAEAAGLTIAKYIRSQGMDAEDLTITYHPPSQALFVYGTVKDMQTRDSILVCCNQVARVARVVDRMQLIAAVADPGLKLAQQP